MDTSYDEDGHGRGFSNFLHILRTRWLVVALPLVLVPAFALAYSLSQQEEYRAAATVLLRDTPGSSLKLAPEDLEREAATNLGLASLSRLAQQTADRLGPPVTAGTVARSISVQSEATSNLITFTSEGTSPRLVSRIANAYGQEFVTFRRSSDVRTVRTALRRAQRRATAVQRQLAQLGESQATPGTTARAEQDNERRQLRLTRDSLLREAQELRTAGALTSGNVELTQRASTPGAPFSPKPLRNTLFGVGIGLLLGIGLALLFEMLDRRVRDPDEIERIMRKPLLGVIPFSPALSRNAGRWSSAGKQRDMGAGEKEAFHMLRANLRYLDPDNPASSLLVTSATPGDGKSTVAWNLAAAGANAGNRTILVEAELRRPVFVREFKLPQSKGLSEVLTRGVEWETVLHRFRDGARVNGTDESRASMDVLVAGRVSPNPVDLLQSSRMLDLITELEEKYDLVVIDTPPISVVSDAIPLLSHVGGVVVVTRLGKTTREAAEHLRRQLEDLNAPTLGVVVNGLTSADGYYGDAYGYAGDYEPKTTA